MGKELSTQRIAILVTDGFEQSEMAQPRKALEAEGATTILVSPADGEVQGWNHHEKGATFPVDQPLKATSVDDFDALLLPGGVANPDALRMIPEAVVFVRGFFDQGKPVAAICHGPWMLVEADVVTNRKLTSWPSLKTDIRNAGGSWIDQEVVADQGLVTSRRPDDIPAFNREMIRSFRKGIELRSKAG